MSRFRLHKGTTLLLAYALSFLLQPACAQQIKVGAKTTAGYGWTPWYESHIDPDNPRNIILCGSKWDAKGNASYGFVYSSSDAGESWRTAIEDKNSLWVSEQSCAFGTHGLAYFVADASKVIDGDLHHDLGTTRIYVSHDSGKTWKLGIETGWTDYSTSVVDTNPGPNQDRLYVFFNGLSTFYSSIGKKDAMDSEVRNNGGSRVGMISYKDGDAAVAGPFSSDQMGKERYRGSYPSPSFLLKDGSILTFFSAKRRREKSIREFMVETARTDPSRSTLEAPSKVVSSLDSTDDHSDVDCGTYFLNTSAAYDAEHDRLYFAYRRAAGKICQLFLTNSGDGGRTWSKAQQVSSPQQATEHLYAGLSLAVNRDGTLGMMWQDKYRSGCWQFAVSTDGGRTLTRAQPLGTCSGEASNPSELSTAYLWTSFLQADPKQPLPAIGIYLRNTWNFVARHQYAIVTTPDGVFHAVWGDADNGAGELCIAAIQVTPVDNLISSAVGGLRDVTSKTVVLYGGDQSYDPITKTLTLSVTIRNDDEQPLKVPLKLAVPGVNDLGFAEISNADNRVSGAGAVWDISFAAPDGVIAPGTCTRRFALRFRYLANPETARDSDDILGLSVRVYAKR